MRLGGGSSGLGIDGCGVDAEAVGAADAGCDDSCEPAVVGELLELLSWHATSNAAAHRSHAGSWKRIPRRFAGLRPECKRRGDLIALDLRRSSDEVDEP